MRGEGGRRGEDRSLEPNQPVQNQDPPNMTMSFPPFFTSSAVREERKKSGSIISCLHPWTQKGKRRETDRANMPPAQRVWHIVNALGICNIWVEYGLRALAIHFKRTCNKKQRPALFWGNLKRFYYKYSWNQICYFIMLLLHFPLPLAALFIQNPRH